MFTPVKAVQRACAQDLDEAVHVARIGDQPVLRADRVVGDEVHHQREDVVERQRGDHHLLPGAHGIRHERLELLGIGDQVAVRQRGALRKPGGSAGILQEEEIVAAQRHRREGELRALRERIGERDGVLEPCVHRRTGQRRAGAVAEPDADDLLDRGLADDLGERRRHAVEDDDGLDAGVVELMLELARRIERVHVHLHGAGADDAQHGEREGRDVGQHHRDAIALLHAELALQVGRELARQPIGVGIGQRLAEAAKRGPVGEALHGGLEHLQHRAMRVRIDLARNFFAIGGEPMLA